MTKSRGSRLFVNWELGTTVFPVDGIGPAGKSRFWRVGEFAWELKINTKRLQQTKRRQPLRINQPEKTTKRRHTYSKMRTKTL